MGVTVFVQIYVWVLSYFKKYFLHIYIHTNSYNAYIIFQSIDPLSPGRMPHRTCGPRQGSRLPRDPQAPTWGGGAHGPLCLPQSGGQGSEDDQAHTCRQGRWIGSSLAE